MLFKKRVPEEKADSEALKLMKTRGADFSKPQPVDFYLYLPRIEDAEAVAWSLGDEGYKTLVTPGAGGKDWLCLASTVLFPSEAGLDTVRSRMEALVQPYGGQYDGWEMALDA